MIRDSLRGNAAKIVVCLECCLFSQPPKLQETIALNVKKISSGFPCSIAPASKKEGSASMMRFNKSTCSKSIDAKH